MIGETLGSYRIVDRLGACGMGEVYLARQGPKAPGNRGWTS
jgi:hypothetical protein